MNDPAFDVVIPYQFYNLILTFVTILALLWGMVAIKRVYRMLRVRSAVLSDRLIQIRGLGSYLTYFDGATRSHMDAVVHTRQSMPPVAMEQLNVGAVVKDIDIKSDGYGNYSLGINIESPSKSRVVVLFDYNTLNFQQLVNQARADLGGNSTSNTKLFSTLTGLRALPSGTTSTIFPRFQRNEVCSFECLSEDVAPGNQSVRLALTPTQVSFVQDKIVQPSTADATSKLFIAVMILPASTPRSLMSSPAHRSLGGSSRKHSNRVGIVTGDGDVESADALAIHTHDVDLDAAGDDNSSVKSSSDAGSGLEGFTSGRNPLTNGRRSGSGTGSGTGSGNGTGSPTAHGGYVNADTSEKYEEEKALRNVQSVFAALFVHTVNLAALRTSSASAAATALAAGPPSSSTPPSELIVLDSHLNSYCSLEIFGLASSPLQPVDSAAGAGSPSKEQDRPAENTPSTAGSAAPPAPAAQLQPTETAAAAVCSGGCFVSEDCVVCLTDHKEVLLLPCRYLWIFCHHGCSLAFSSA